MSMLFEYLNFVSNAYGDFIIFIEKEIQSCKRLLDIICYFYVNKECYITYIHNNL